uniref:Reverse transcriptase domain-containing protein n=1 Tax=Tanacetum cinerariifolium TaxID=118510 RepID=A0A6L2K0M4_TANCI|nr:hypothetical protein [Tanacetum cinerariifolium]
MRSGTYVTYVVVIILRKLCGDIVVWERILDNENVMATLNSRDLKKRTEGTKEVTSDGLCVRGRLDHLHGHLKRDCLMKMSSEFARKGKRDQDFDSFYYEGNAYFIEALMVVRNDETTELVSDIQKKDKIEAKTNKIEYRMEKREKSKSTKSKSTKVKVKDGAKIEEILNGPTRTHSIGQCMRTHSSSNPVGESSPNSTSLNLKCHNRRRSKQPFILEESRVDTMADQRTMAELLCAPTEGYAEAIVVPPILAEHFELKHRILEDKIICDLDKTPNLSQRSPQSCPKCGHPVNGHYCQGGACLRKKFKEDLFTSCIEHVILQDSFEPSNDNSNVVNAPREPFVVNQDPGKNSSQSPPQINHHCCYGCGDPLEVPIIPNSEPFNNLTIEELPPTVQRFDPKSDFVYDSPNVFDPPPQLPFIQCEFCRNDARYGQYCTPQVPFVYLEPCYNQDFNFWQEFHHFQQQDLCCENCRVTHEAYQCQPKLQDYYHEQNSCYDHSSFGFDQSQPHQYTKEEEQAANAQYWKIPACYDDDDDDYTFEITSNEPVNSLCMGDEYLDTIPAMESDEVIKSSVENLVPIPSESKGELECDMQVCEAFTTFSNIVFDSGYDFYSSDDQSFSDEDLPKEIYLNPLFDEEIIPMKIDLHHFNAESDLIESMLNHNSSIIISLKIDSLFDEFAGELTLLKSIPPGIDETDCHPEEETHFTKRLLYDNSSPRPPKEFVFENFDAEIESFSPSHIPIEDSDSLMKEIDLSFIPDYPMPSDIKDDDYDSKRDILILDELLGNDSLSLLENESFHFDIPSSFRPHAKPPDGNTWILNVKIMGNISEQKVHMPRFMITLVPNLEKSPDLLSHQGHKAFQPSAECPDDDP